jgi:hypothetical protein
MTPSPDKKRIFQSMAGCYPCNAVLFRWKLQLSPACALCGGAVESVAHIQCVCPALKDARIRAHHNLANLLWDEILRGREAWSICREATVDSLHGLSAPDNCFSEWEQWQRALDRFETDMELEVEAEDGDPEVALMRKRPDGWAVNWEQRTALILEFTRPNDRDLNFSARTDGYKRERYLPLQEKLTRFLAEWKVDILTFTLGIRGSFQEATWKANLDRFGITGARSDQIMKKMVSRCLTELNSLFNVHRAATIARQHGNQQ